MILKHVKKNLDMHKRNKHKDIIQPRIQYQQPVQMKQQVQGGHDHYVQVQQALVHHPLDNQVQGLDQQQYGYPQPLLKQQVVYPQHQAGVQQPLNNVHLQEHHQQHYGYPQQQVAAPSSHCAKGPEIASASYQDPAQGVHPQSHHTDGHYPTSNG